MDLIFDMYFYLTGFGEKWGNIPFYHFRPIKHTAHNFFQKSLPDFENSVDPDQLASVEALIGIYSVSFTQ